MMYSSLDSISGFPWENYLQVFHPMIKSGTNCLAQVGRRLSEKEHSSEQGTEEDSVVDVDTKEPNNSYIVNGNYCDVLELLYDNLYQCKMYRTREPLFTNPCNSSKIGCYKVMNDSSYFCTVGKENMIIQAIKYEYEYDVSLTTSKPRSGHHQSQ